MDYIKEAIEQLKEYNNLIAAEKNLVSQINALRIEKDNLKATTLSFAAGGGGVGEHDDKIVNNIYMTQVLSKNLAATKKRIRSIEGALAVLTEGENLVLNRMFVIGGKRAVENLMDSLGYEKAQIYRIKDLAIKKFATALFGIERS